VDFLQSTNSGKITNLYVLLDDGFYSQAGPDNSDGRSAKYAGDVNKPGFCGRLFFSLGYYWLSSSSSRGRLRPLPFCRCSRLASDGCRLCRLRHGFFNSGGWTEASLSCSSHRVLVLFAPLICRVGRRNILRPLQIQLSVCKAR
jgi:hypothetical protein